MLGATATEDPEIQQLREELAQAKEEIRQLTWEK